MAMEMTMRHSNILSHAMCASDKCDETRQGQTLRAHSRSRVHVVLRVVSLDLGFHVVIGVVRQNV